MLHQQSEVLTTILIKFDKVTVLLPINKSTTLKQIKQSFLKIIQSTSPKSNQFNHINQFNFFRKDQSSTKWIPISDDSSSLIDLGCKEAEVLGLGFVDSNGICSEPNIQVWIESEINQEE